MDQRKLQMFNNEEKDLIEIVNQSISDYILAVDKDEIIDEDTINRMSSSLTLFAANAINKFLAGQVKHGGKITDKDLDKEINQEVTDLFWYLEAKEWQMEIYENECREETKEINEKSSTD